MERHAADRPNVVHLQNHVFFKQCKHTSLAEQFSVSGIDVFRCTKTATNEDVGLVCDMADMTIGSNFEWDFS